MAAALALAIMLVVVVAVVSLAVNSQAQVPGAQRAGSPRSGRTGHPGSGPSAPRSPRRPPREKGERAKGERGKDRAGPEQARREQPAPSEKSSDPDQVFGDLRPLNKTAKAVVLSVVDERTLGPVTRCRLTLRVEPGGEDAFEVTARVAFPTPEERARVKVGATVAVRYDSEDHRRIVVETDKPAGD
ncbi:MAG: hypothetical protein M0005_16165 [Actinomycetota bacterium]|jgi:hypothetical protein|nr:hypothetical protein [Actinomycetota bacterium]